MSTLEQRRDTVISFAEDCCEELMAMVSDMGGDPDYLASWAEKLADDIHVAFSDAIEARDERRTPESHGYPSFEVGTHQNKPSLKSCSKVDRSTP